MSAGVMRGASVGTPLGCFRIVAINGFSTGVPLLLMAILGEYVGRIAHAVNGRALELVPPRVAIGPVGTKPADRSSPHESDCRSHDPVCHA
jgi:hypothetical protein